MTGFRFPVWQDVRSVKLMHAAMNHNEMLPGGWFLLDVDTKDLNQVKIEKEMTDSGMVSWASLRLAHSDGSLVMRAYSPGQKESQNQTVPLGHVWLRSEDGRYRLLTESGRYKGEVLEMSIKTSGSWQQKPFPIDMTPLR